MIAKILILSIISLVSNVWATSDLNKGYKYFSCIKHNKAVNSLESYAEQFDVDYVERCGDECDQLDHPYASLSEEYCFCGNISDPFHLNDTIGNCGSCKSNSPYLCGALPGQIAVYIKFADTCATNCDRCTVNECVVCKIGFDNVAGSCIATSTDPCDSHDCSDVCTPDGSSFTCSCNAANRYLMTDGETCEDCSAALPNCLTCTDNTTCTACSTGYNLEASGDCVATPTNPNNMAASINGDPHVMIKNSNNGDSFCFDITAHSGNDDNGIHIIQDTPSTLKVDGKLELCGSGMSCLEEVVIEHDGNTMKFVAKDDTNNTPAKLIVGGLEYQWDQQGSLTSGSITLNSVSGTDNVKLIKIDLSATDVVEMNVHQFGGSTFKYLGIIFKNNVFSSNLDGALGQYIGKSFTVNPNQDELTFASNTPLSVSAVQRYNPASRTIEPCYLHANSNNDLVKTYLYDYS